MSTTTTKPEFEKRALRVNEFCARYNLGRSQTYALLGSGELPSFLVGGTRLIPTDAAEAMLKRCDPLRPSHRSKKSLVKA